MMFKRIRRRFNATGLVAVFALVFAMSGGAYATSRYVITSTKQISPKVLKALKGSAGASGAQGSAGPAGSAGPLGPAGPQGPAGPAGATGKEGPAGKNGENGKNGETGFTETLPEEKTETGTWAIAADAVGPALASISFSIPLGGSLDESHVLFVEDTPPTQCSGTVEAPAAAPGYLCVYAGEKASISFEGILNSHLEAGASAVGAVLAFSATGAGAIGFGSWAVTASS